MWELILQALENATVITLQKQHPCGLIQIVAKFRLFQATFLHADISIIMQPPTQPQVPSPGKENDGQMGSWLGILGAFFQPARAKTHYYTWSIRVCWWPTQRGKKRELEDLNTTVILPITSLVPEFKRSKWHSHKGTPKQSKTDKVFKKYIWIFF